MPAVVGRGRGWRFWKLDGDLLASSPVTLLQGHRDDVVVASLLSAAASDIDPTPPVAAGGFSTPRASPLLPIPPAPPWPAGFSLPSVSIPDRIISRFNSRLDQWSLALRNPDGSFWHSKADYILDAIRCGVRLGYSGPRDGYVVTKNHPSANTEAAQAIIDGEILGELRLGRMAGPLSLDLIRTSFPFFRNSPMAVVPKPNSTKWRVIDDLTAGGTASVNAHISDEDSAVKYMSFNCAIRSVQRLGRGCFMGKIDWEAAFRQVAVHKDDLPLLGLAWRDLLFVRLVLPFGARSSPKLFTVFAGAFMAILRREVATSFPHTPTELVYYLDDFFLAARSSSECQEAMKLMISLADRLGVALHPDKREGPSRVIQFLGIEIDSVNMVVRLPSNKKSLLVAACQKALSTGSSSAKDLDRLIGRMGHACNVVEPGRWMLSRIREWRNRLPFGRNEHIPYSLPDFVKEDLGWWIDAMSSWDSRRSIHSYFDTSRHGLILQTDASSSSGVGAVLLSREGEVKAWLSCTWPPGSSFASWSSAAFELAAIVVALASFDDLIDGKSIKLHSDSAVAVSVLRKQSAKAALTARLMRGISAMMLSLDTHIHSSHIKGAHNVIADVASRVSLQKADYMRLLGLLPRRRRPAVWPRWLIRLTEIFC